MKGLRTARVLIIDDQADEAMPVIQVLGSLGIGCVYISGENIEEVEKTTAFSGIRLAFVDMKLGIEGTAKKEVVAKTVKVLSLVLSKKTLPIVLVAWTDHPEFVDEFASAVKRELPFLAPLLIQRMPKPKLAGGLISFPKVRASLRRILNAHWPLGIIWSLEQLVHEATSETTQAMADVVAQATNGNGSLTDAQRVNEWLQSLQSLLRMLIFAAAGSNLDRRGAQVGLLEAFSAMHFERLQTVAFPALLGEVSKLCRLQVPKLSTDQRAILNSMLLLTPADSSEPIVKPGNLYLPRPRRKLKCPLTRCGITSLSVAAAMPFKLTKDVDWKALEDKVRDAEKKKQRANAAKFKKAGTKRRRAILRSCLPVLLELTPPCDYSHQKMGAARFIAGLLVPESHAKLLEWGERPFLRRIEPLMLPGKTGVWHLILNVRALYTISNPGTKIDSVATVRFRESIQSDIQAWFAASAARPGYLSIR